jgi:hypothetical protein
MQRMCEISLSSAQQAPDLLSLHQKSDDTLAARDLTACKTLNQDEHFCDAD